MTKPSGEGTRKWPDRESLAWAAGFYDGEGSLTLAKRQTGRHPYPCINIQQIDPSPLERVRDALGVGKVRGPYQDHRSSRQPVWNFSITRFDDVQAAVAMLWHWLSEPKRQQVRRVFGRYKESRTAIRRIYRPQRRRDAR